MTKSLTKKEIKNKKRQDWITALRSNKYKQQQWVLGKDDKKFCATGLLYRINNIYDRVQGPFANIWTATEAVAELEKEVGIRKGGLNVVIQLNDDGKSYKEIADFLVADLAKPLKEREVFRH